MNQTTVRLVELLMRLLPPPTGRHSAPPLTTAPPPTSPGVRTTPVRSCSEASHRRCERAELRLRRQRRRALWLAVHGVDIGPRVIHGMAVFR